MQKATMWLAATVVLFGTSALAEPPGGAFSAERVEMLRRLIQEEMDRHGIPGLSAAVATADGSTWSAGFGLADVEHHTPAQAETLYRTASIAKPMTAALVLDLAEDEQLDLDEPVQKYCPEFPEKRWAVTSRRLLGHLGGVRHYKSRAESTATRRYFSLREALATFADDPLMHPPGARFLYSTFGYNLLGSVAEGAGRRPFIELLRKRVLMPCRMTATRTDSQIEIVEGRARGYVRFTKQALEQLPEGHRLQAGQLYNAPFHDTSMKIPGGGLLSTAPDLIRFARGVAGRRILEADTTELMWTSGRTAFGDRTNYGLGWQLGRAGGRFAVSHSGGQAGVSTHLLLTPDTGAAVALMCNLQSVRLRRLAESLLATVQPPHAVDYQPVAQRVAAAIRAEMQQKDLPAVSIALIDDQQTVWAEGFGFQDAERRRPATADTIYRVGSVSKLFTDIAIMQFVERGELELDAPVRDYLPTFQPRTTPENAPITLRQLMSHRSGLVREPPVGHYFDPTEPTLAATVESLNTTKLVYPPGERTKYSNAGVAVLGAVLESQRAATFAEQIDASVLKPLEMRSSSFSLSPEFADRMAAGWMWTYDDRRFQAPTFSLGMAPAGNLYSSVNELSALVKCIFADGRLPQGPGEAKPQRLLRANTLRAMTTPPLDADGRPQRFGLGFHIESLDGRRKIGHGGAVYGFSTQLEALPNRKLGVAVACNLDVSNRVVSRIADYALELMLAQSDGQSLPEYRTTGDPPAARIAELAGLYRKGDGSPVRIESYGNRLLLDQGSFRRQLRADRKSGSIVADDLLGFGDSVRLDAAGNLLIADAKYDRVDDEIPPPPPARWQGLIGEYGWDHNTLYILEKHGKLHALIEWFFLYPLDEIGPNEFAFPDYGLYHGERLKFTRDQNDRATQVVAAEIVFERRAVGPEEGETFKITPVKPIAELRKGALASKPPVESGAFRAPELTELKSLAPSLKLDIRYATTNNFMGAVFYKQPRAFLQRPAAEALARVSQRLQPRGFGLLIHDAYRPWHVTKMFWDATPDELRKFVANPAKGSRHNRGSAVDLSLYDLRTGEPVSMVAGYDEFSPRSYPLYPGGTSRQRWLRRLLRDSMAAEQFSIYEYEWWHFDHRDWKQYRIGNETFEELGE